MIGGNWYWGVLENVAGLMQCSTRSANTLYGVAHLSSWDCT
jgi:hypothetical protein